MSLRILVTIGVLALVTPLLWLTYGYASAYHLYGSTAIATTFRIATATTAAAALFVIVVVRLVFQPAYTWIARQPPTHLQIGVAITLATFVAVASALAWFGVDLSTILTTSALVTAIVGLSIQPLLASLMSGLALQRTVRIGDGILLSGKPVSITSLDWRTVVARRSDGTSLVIPNSHLAAETLEVLPRDRPVRGSVTIELPAEVAPHRVREEIIRIAAGIGEIDAGRPISVLPQACRFGGSVAHVASFWVTRFDGVPAAEARMLRRAWYAFRRNGVAADAQPDPAGEVSVAAIRGTLSSTEVDLGALGSDFAERAVREGLHLHYDDGERIVLPARAAGDMVCVLAAGRIEISGDSAAGPDSVALPTTPWSVERALASRIGPYASVVVRDAVKDGASMVALCHAAADEIDDPGERAAFMAEVLPPPRQIRMPGTVFRCVRNPAGALAHDPPARAVDHAHLIALRDR